MSMEQDDFLRTFFSSPQSFDVIEQTKKQIKKKKRKTVHKHLLIQNILLENDHSRLTFRQRILQKKFQSKKNEMGDIDLIRSGIDIIPFNINNKMVFKSKYKVKIPVYSKLRLKVSFQFDEFNYEKNEEGLIKEEKLKLVNNEEDKNIVINNGEDKNIVINNEEEKLKLVNNEEDNILVSDNNIAINNEVNNNIVINNEETDIKKIEEEKNKPDKYFEDIKISNVINNENHCNPKKRQLSLYKDELNHKIFKILEQNKKEDKVLKNNQICVYKKINIFELFSNKSTKKITRLSLDEVDIYEANNNLYISEDEDKKCEIIKDEISDKLEMINFNNVNKTMLIKKKKVLFKSEKKKNEDCINKTAYYITELEKIPKYTKKIEKKCIYYTDILIKEFKKKGCVCRVIGEVKWYIKKIKDEYSFGNISI